LRIPVPEFLRGWRVIGPGASEASFTQADVARAIRAAQQARPGVKFAIEIAPGGIVRIVPVEPKVSPLSPKEDAYNPIEPPGGWRL